MTLEVIILAAGKGTRMKSTKPKVLHRIANKPMILHIYDNVKKLNPSKIHVVYGFGGEKLKEELKKIESDINFVFQKDQLGTAHAVNQALPYVDKDSHIIVLNGDVPLLSFETMKKMIDSISETSFGILTTKVKNPYGLGRIIRDEKGNFLKIVEEKDADTEIKKINEINVGVYYGQAQQFIENINLIKNSNKQNEYYLTDICALLLTKNQKVECFLSFDEDECLGVNDHIQQSYLEKIIQRKNAENLMKEGVTIIDPNRFDLRGNLICGSDVVIDVNVIIEGNVKIGNNVYVGPGCILKNCEINDFSEISPYSVIESSILGKNNTIGPFSRLRPGNKLEDDVHVGNFVEIKNSSINDGTKAGHLTYIGDSIVGQNVNFGAGTITCNYDGANKHKTVIGNNVFIGSDTQLVAPVEIEDNATLGAGSTITKKVSKDQLVITRVPQKHINNWNRPKKK